MTGDFVKNKLKEGGHTLTDVATALGITPQHLQSKFKSNDIKVGVLESIAEAINESVSFFFTDNQIASDPTAVYKLRTDSNIQDQAIPLYDIEAVAGLVPLFTNAQETKPIDHISIPNLPKCDGAVHITGDSMYPLLKSGDIIMYKEIQDIANDIFWGEMYLLSISMSGEEMVVVKFLQKSDKGEGYVKLVSQNKHHQDRDIKITRIMALALVKASVRINSMS